MIKTYNVLKILIAGDAAVGKTTLLCRYVEGKFSTTAKMTIGVEFFEKDEEDLHLQIWDIGGQERFRFMIKSFLKGAHGALLLYDITNFTSFVNITKWVQLIRSMDKELTIVLVATKYDLEEYSLVGDYYAKLCQKQHNLMDYVKTSSKTGHNVHEAFDILSKNILNMKISCNS